MGRLEVGGAQLGTVCQAPQAPIGAVPSMSLELDRAIDGLLSEIAAMATTVQPVSCDDGAVNPCKDEPVPIGLCHVASVSYRQSRDVRAAAARLRDIRESLQL